MRRPVKPFVTEYKGSARRGKDSRPDPEVEDGKPKARDAAASEPKARDPRAGTLKTAAKGSDRTRRGAAEARGLLPPRGPFRGADDAEPIDSYEAAMRAADALFSPKGKAGPGGEATGLDEAAPAAEAAGEDRTAATPAAATEPTGRVLRALDEPEPTAPEPMPELAPKRRGRKPRSVNKPKAETKASEGARRRLAETAAAQEPDEAEEEVDAEEIAAEPCSPSPPMAGPAPAGAMAADGQLRIDSSPKRQRDRFPWVRTKLRPGEKWKRRLPKVAW